MFLKWNVGVIFMLQFDDMYDNKVMLSFEYLPFSEHPKHVWVICKYRDTWLLTKHKNRGLEFPGGKVEQGESADEAAIREVKEETGGIVDQLYYIGQYKVNGREKTIIKNVYFAQIKEIEKQAHYFETKGPVLLQSLPSNIKSNNAYSFIMKDDVLTFSIQQLKEKQFIE